MDWQQKGRWHGSANVDNRGFENEQNHKLYHKFHGKLEDGIDSGRSNYSRGKNPKRHIPGKFTLITAIHYSNDVTQLHTGSYKFSKSQEKIIYLMHMVDIEVFGINKNNQKPWYK